MSFSRRGSSGSSFSRTDISHLSSASANEHGSSKLVLRIQFPQASAKLSGVFQFEADMQIEQALQQIAQKCDLDTSIGEFGLFINWDDDHLRGTWLDSKKRLSDYHLPPSSSVLYKNKRRPLNVEDLDGGSRKKVIVNETSPVSVLTSIIAKRYCIEDASEFSLQTHTDGIFHWLDPDKNLPEQGVTEAQSVVLRKKFFVTDMMVTVKQPALLHLLYLEGRHCIVSGIYPSNLEQAVQFAALQMQIKYGNYDPLLHVASFLNLNEFIPKRYRATPFIEEDVYREHRKLHGSDELETKSRYLRKCLKMPTYGATFRAAIEKPSENDMENEILFGVNCDALLRMHRKSKDILGRNLLVEVLGVTALGQSLTLRFKGRSREFMFESAEDAVVLRDLILGYKQFQQMKRKENFAHAQLQKISSTQISPQMAPLRLVGSQQRLKALHLMSISIPSPSPNAANDNT